jgi:Transglycosylase SLT domain
LPLGHVEGTHHFGHLPDSSIESAGNCSETPAAIHRGQRLQSAVATARNQAIGFFRKQNGAGAESVKKLDAECPQIAGQNQIPFAGGIHQRGLHAGQRTVSRPAVGNHRIAESGVFLRFPDNAYPASHRSGQCSISLDQSDTIDLQESFIRTHPRAVPARQDVTGYAHAEMITLKFVPTCRLSLLLAFALLPAVLCAEEAVSTRTTLIVKADNRSGRLVRSVVVAPKVVTAEDPNQPEAMSPAPAPGVNSLSDMIDSIAAKHDVEAPLVHSVIKAESNYNPLAVSPKGAQGLMQLIPSTARRFGVENTFNPQQNIEGGVKYLKFLMELYHNDYVKVIAAYNAGEAAVTKYGGIPPYAETRNYVYQVGKNLQTARKVAEIKNAVPKPETPKPAVANPDQPRSIQAVVGPDGKVYYKTQ